jgi:toluene monooxygenase system protein D
MMSNSLGLETVGPVLMDGGVADAVIAAIRERNSGVVIVPHGSYHRVLVPHRCVVSRTDIEQHLGRSVKFPGDLEMIMSSFKGEFSVHEDRAEWIDRQST